MVCCSGALSHLTARLLTSALSGARRLLIGAGGAAARRPPADWRGGGGPGSGAHSLPGIVVPIFTERGRFSDACRVHSNARRRSRLLAESAQNPLKRQRAGVLSRFEPADGRAQAPYVHSRLLPVRRRRSEFIARRALDPFQEQPAARRRTYSPSRRLRRHRAGVSRRRPPAPAIARRRRGPLSDGPPGVRSRSACRRR
ncbi:hypothetical protein chiPu_0021019 [Chiloscyllium punctatum]|uniref:Uncharacterized protein n=1 Tax=Chiloscyllium punctatum TaxID=137246 RepID=A0A401RME9_CHIPU|nr:hypothetical protein [Chiloscyllium punctatum]